MFRVSPRYSRAVTEQPAGGAYRAAEIAIEHDSLNRFRIGVSAAVTCKPNR